MKKVLMIQRAEVLSPNAVEKDLAVLQSLGRRLQQRGMAVSYVKEEQLQNVDDDVDYVFSMGRLTRTLEILRRCKASVINSPEGVANCNSRRKIDCLMRKNGIPAAPEPGDGIAVNGRGLWLKSDFGHDVRFVTSPKEFEQASREMKNPVVTQHVEGEVVKFYGVGDCFFYPSGYHDLQQKVQQLADLADVKIYGGDAVVKDDGTYAIIDFNDWPSFSKCRETAAEMMAQLI